MASGRMCPECISGHLLSQPIVDLDRKGAWDVLYRLQHGDLCLRVACHKVAYAQKAAQKWGLMPFDASGFLVKSYVSSSCLASASPSTLRLKPAQMLSSVIM